MKKDFFKKIIINKIWIVLIVVCLVRFIVYNFYTVITTYPDTSSYINFTENILRGEINAFRTPIYPYIIKLISIFTINESVMLKTITLLQEVVSIASVIVLYITLKKEFKNQIITCLTTIVYGCFPAIFTYNRVILTESLSISLFVMYFCLILKYMKTPTNSKTIWIGICTILLIMLRPAFLYLIVALAIMFLLIFIFKKENRKQAILGGIVLVGVGIIILGYCYLNKKQNDVFAISSVTQINQLDNVIQMGIYNTGDEQDEEIIEIIDKKLDGDWAVWHTETALQIKAKYTPSQIDEFLSRCVKNNFGTYLRKTINKVVDLAYEPCNQIYLKALNVNMISPIIYFIFVYIYMIVTVIYIVVQTIKNKKLPLEKFIMLIIILGQFATIILGAQAEYSRLFAPVMPIIIISIAWQIEKTLETMEIELNDN